MSSGNGGGRDDGGGEDDHVLDHEYQEVCMCRIAYLIAEPIDLMPIPIRSSTLGVCEELAGDEPLRMQMAAWKEVEDQAGSSSSQGARLPLPWLVACLFICCLRLIIDRFINRNQSINN